MTEKIMPVVYTERPRLEEVAPNVWRVDLPMPREIGPTNSYIFKADGVHDSGRSLIIDVGCDEPETKAAFDAALQQLDISWDAVDVFITHFHWDHCAGLSRIWRPGMTVYGGLEFFRDRGVAVMAAHEVGELERTVSQQHDVGDTYDPAFWFPMTKMGSGEFPITCLHEGEVLHVGEYALRVLETPGHDLHHLCLYDVEHSLFVGGDQIMISLYPPVMVEGDEDQLSIMLDTLRRLGSLDANVVLCGHGDEFSGLKERIAKILDHYERQLAGFLPLCQEQDTDDIGELAYLSTQLPRRRPWEARSIFGRRSLVNQTEAYVKYLVCAGKLPDIYEFVPLR